MGSSPRRARRRRALITLTPLVDVVFILVVFFMLASSLGPRGALPVIAGATGVGGASTGLFFEITVSGLVLNGRPVEAAALPGMLAASAAETVLLRPAAGIDVQATVAALEALRDAGADQVRLVAPP